MLHGESKITLPVSLDPLPPQLPKHRQVVGEITPQSTRCSQFQINQELDVLIRCFESHHDLAIF